MTVARWRLTLGALVVGFAVLPSAALAQEENPRLKKQVVPKPARAQVQMQEQPAVSVVEIAQATSLPSTITDRDRSALTRIASDLQGDNTESAISRWRTLVEGLTKGDKTTDTNALIQWVLRESYLETNKDLQFYAEKVRFYNSIKKKVRQHIHELRETLAGMQSDETVRVQTISTAPRYEAAAEPVRAAAAREMNDKDLALYALEWCDELQTIGDDAQLANTDLQNALQKQQQTLQTISNVSKMLHDTAMGVIRKIAS